MMPCQRGQRDRRNRPHGGLRISLHLLFLLSVFFFFSSLPLQQDLSTSTSAPHPLRQKTARHPVQKWTNPQQQQHQHPSQQQPLAKPSSEKPQSTTVSPQPPSAAAPGKPAASAPSRDDLLVGFFYSGASSSQPEYSYTLGIHPAADGDRTRGEWELYEDYDPTKLVQHQAGITAVPRRRTTWSGRWSLQPEKDNFGWVKLVKTSEVVQQNGQSTERQCRMVQCCPYNLTTTTTTTTTAASTRSSEDEVAATKMGIMLNAFHHTGGLFLTRSLS